MVFGRFGKALKKGEQSYRKFQENMAKNKIAAAERNKRVYEAQLKAARVRADLNKQRKKGGSTFDRIFGPASNNRMSFLVDEPKKKKGMDEFLKI